MHNWIKVIAWLSVSLINVRFVCENWKFDILIFIIILYNDANNSVSNMQFRAVTFFKTRTKKLLRKLREKTWKYQKCAIFD